MIFTDRMEKILIDRICDVLDGNRVLNLAQARKIAEAELYFVFQELGVYEPMRRKNKDKMEARLSTRSKIAYKMSKKPPTK